MTGCEGDSCGCAIDDIEDFINKDSEDVRRTGYKKSVLPHVRVKMNQNVEKIDTSLGNAPATECVWVKTWGCTHNTSDSEYMAGQLASHGYRVTDNPEEADLWLLNSCTVKNPAEDHFRNMIQKGKDANKHVVLAGCVPQGAPQQAYIKGLSVIGVQQIDRVVEVVEETLKGNSVRLLSQKKANGKKIGGSSLSLPKIRRNPLIEIISVNTGCLNSCTYCKTRYARGVLGSYPVEDIVERAIESFKEGVVEIWLTSEDTGAYGLDIGTNLPTLLWALVKVIPEGCMLRVGMTNPPYILNQLDEISKILNHPRVYAFMHVPVQAGSNRTLYEMRREYTVEDFSTVVDVLRENVPGISIATDIICGFPSEQDVDFEETLNLCEKYKFPSLFINQFFPRPGTPAANMEQINRKEIKKRTKKLSELFQSYRPYEHQLGKVQKILITEIAHDGESLVGHNKFYEQVLLKEEGGSEKLMGKMVTVKVIETGKHFIRGERIMDEKVISPTEVAPLPRGVVSGGITNSEKRKEQLQQQQQKVVEEEAPPVKQRVSGEESSSKYELLTVGGAAVFAIVCWFTLKKYLR